MDKKTLLKHLKTASEIEVIENIAAGPSDSMAFRYHASLNEMERRNKRLPLILSIVSIGISFISLFTAVISSVVSLLR